MNSVGQRAAGRLMTVSKAHHLVNALVKNDIAFMPN